MLRVVGTVMALSFAATLAEAQDDKPCYKQGRGGFVYGSSRICQFNGLVDDWLIANGAEPEETLATYQWITQLSADSGDYFFPPIWPIRPSALVEINYTLGPELTRWANEVRKLRPGFFNDLEVEIGREIKRIVCGDYVERDFVVSGGGVTYLVRVLPLFTKGRPWHVQVEMNHRSCEKD